MDSLVDFLYLVSGAPSKLAGGLPSGGFLLLLALALFGAQLVNNLSHRRSFFHLVISVTVMFVGALASNALLAGLRIPLSHELLVSTAWALVGMTVSGLILIATYRRVDI